MKQFAKLLNPQGYIKMNDGVQIFDGAVITAMDKIRLWDEMDQSFMKEVNGVQFFLSVGWNANYFKTDGQNYCTHLHIAKEGKCYLHACLCEFIQKDIETDLINLSNRVEFLISDESYNFEESFTEKQQSYPWQTS